MDIWTERKKQLKNWTDIIDLVRTKLNEIRKKKLPIDPYAYEYPPFDNVKETKDKKGKIKTTLIMPIFKIGELVYRKLEVLH